MIRFLGTGTSTGVPQIGCKCKVCSSSDLKDKRLRSSVMIETEKEVLLIDCTPDFRQQMIPLPFKKINGILFTHEHYDHVGGIDDLRPFSSFGAVELYMEEHLEYTIRERMPYCFTSKRYGGVPDIKINRINERESFTVGSLNIIPIRVMHNKLPILGFRINNIAYLTDVKSIPESEFDKLKGLELLVLSALRKSEHISHLTLSQAIKLSNKIVPKRTYLTHLSHEMGLHADIENDLPSSFHVAHDSLELDFV